MGTSTDLDDTDRALLAHLSTNARLPVAKLATRMGLARTTVQALSSLSVPLSLSLFSSTSMEGGEMKIYLHGIALLFTLLTP